MKSKRRSHRRSNRRSHRRSNRRSHRRSYRFKKIRSQKGGALPPPSPSPPRSFSASMPLIPTYSNQDPAALISASSMQEALVQLLNDKAQTYTGLEVRENGDYFKNFGSNLANKLMGDGGKYHMAYNNYHSQFKIDSGYQSYLQLIQGLRFILDYCNIYGPNHQVSEEYHSIFSKLYTNIFGKSSTLKIGNTLISSINEINEIMVAFNLTLIQLQIANYNTVLIIIDASIEREKSKKYPRISDNLSGVDNERGNKYDDDNRMPDLHHLFPYIFSVNEIISINALKTFMEFLLKGIKEVYHEKLMISLIKVSKNLSIHDKLLVDQLLKDINTRKENIDREIKLIHDYIDQYSPGEIKFTIIFIDDDRFCPTHPGAANNADHTRVIYDQSFNFGVLNTLFNRLYDEDLYLEDDKDWISNIFKKGELESSFNTMMSLERSNVYKILSVVADQDDTGNENNVQKLNEFTDDLWNWHTGDLYAFATTKDASPGFHTNQDNVSGSEKERAKKEAVSELEDKKAYYIELIQKYGPKNEGKEWLDSLEGIFLDSKMEGEASSTREETDLDNLENDNNLKQKKLDGVKRQFEIYKRKKTGFSPNIKKQLNASIDRVENEIKELNLELKNIKLNNKKELLEKISKNKLKINDLKYKLKSTFDKYKKKMRETGNVDHIDISLKGGANPMAALFKTDPKMVINSIIISTLKEIRNKQGDDISSIPTLLKKINEKERTQEYHRHKEYITLFSKYIDNIIRKLQGRYTTVQDYKTKSKITYNKESRRQKNLISSLEEFKLKLAEIKNVPDAISSEELESLEKKLQVLQKEKEEIENEIYLEKDKKMNLDNDADSDFIKIRASILKNYDLSIAKLLKLVKKKEVHKRKKERTGKGRKSRRSRRSRRRRRSRS